MRHLLLVRKYTQLHWIKNECFLLGDPFCSGSVLHTVRILPQATIILVLDGHFDGQSFTETKPVSEESKLE